MDLITDPEACVHVHVKHSRHAGSQLQPLSPNLCAVIEPNANGAPGPKRPREGVGPVEVQEGNEGAGRGGETTGASAPPQPRL